eukprot:173494-Prymnesium_polylepis.1
MGPAMLKTRFPWGDKPFEMRLVPYILVLGSLLTAAAICLPSITGPSVTAGGPVLVTLGWLHTHYNALGAQVKVKMAGPAADEQATKIAERSVYNGLEQGVPFLVLVWLHAALVDAATATSVGGSYVGLRLLYPAAYAYYGEFSMLCELVTLPNYCALFYRAQQSC